MMNRIEKTLEAMRMRPQNVAFSDLFFICEYFFGAPRNSGSSHFVFKMPWPGDPRVNIQKGSNNKAKAYQVKQALKAIERINHGK
ncbi:toxin HicA [Bartonella sp. DGB2]|uniref:toxin HicA n=1 Tax=Bartonella sp. DGB2 TaxID=3388426 RepID=UPI00398FF0DF